MKANPPSLKHNFEKDKIVYKHCQRRNTSWIMYIFKMRRTGVYWDQQMLPSGTLGRELLKKLMGMLVPPASTIATMKRTRVTKSITIRSAAWFSNVTWGAKHCPGNIEAVRRWRLQMFIFHFCKVLPKGIFSWICTQMINMAHEFLDFKGYSQICNMMVRQLVPWFLWCFPGKWWSLPPMGCASQNMPPFSTLTLRIIVTALDNLSW